MKRYIPATCSTSKTYATEAGAIKAAEKDIEQHPHWADCQIVIMQADNGRWVPVYVGMKTIELGIHFHRHCVA